MATQIIGNQINQVTRAIMEALQVTEQINLPNLNQTQINALGTPAYGTLVYNSTEDMAQIYLQDAAQGVPGWDDVGGGGPSVGEESIIRTNGPQIQQNITVGPVANGGAEFTNGFSAGPIQIDNGYTVTVENGARWTIIGGEENDLSEGTPVQVKYAQTEPLRYTIRSQNVSDGAIPGLEINIQPTHTDSKILLIANIMSTGQHVSSFGFMRQIAGGGQTTLEPSGHPGNNSSTGNGRIATWYRGDDTQGHIMAHTVMYMDMPSTQNMCSYVVGGTSSWGGSIRDLYINDRDSNDMRGISSFIAMEVR